MAKENTMGKLVEEIKLYIQYAVPKSSRRHADELVERYDKDGLILALLREYYSTLPEAREEAVERIGLLTSRQGIFLFVVITGSNAYLYVVSEAKVVFLGEYGGEIEARLLAYFEFSSQKDFLKNCLPVDELKEYESKENGELSFCSACGVAPGEFHLLGCVVEVCPWCQGQLSNCNCRFEQLKIEEIEDEKQLDEFYDLLTAKGRITFQREQSPAYPGAGEGLDEA